MKVIGFDTTTQAATIALLEDGSLLMETILNTDKTHSQRLMPMLDLMLRAADITLAQIDGIAVASGPGSFTGLRIGMTTAKTLAWSLAKPLAAVPTLDALALNAQGAAGCWICPALNARRNQIYTALYKQSHGSIQRQSEYMAIGPEGLIDLLKHLDGQVVLLGDAVPEYAQVIIDSLGDRVHVLTPPNWLPRAAHVAYLGWDKLKKGESDDAVMISPFYIRPSEAELKLAAKKVCE